MKTRLESRAGGTSLWDSAASGTSFLSAPDAR